MVEPVKPRSLVSQLDSNLTQIGFEVLPRDYVARPHHGYLFAAHPDVAGIVVCEEHILFDRHARDVRLHVTLTGAGQLLRIPLTEAETCLEKEIHVLAPDELGDKHLVALTSCFFARDESSRVRAKTIASLLGYSKEISHQVNIRNNRSTLEQLAAFLQLSPAAVSLLLWMRRNMNQDPFLEFKKSFPEVLFEFIECYFQENRE